MNSEMKVPIYKISIDCRFGFKYKTPLEILLATM